MGSWSKLGLATVVVALAGCAGAAAPAGSPARAGGRPACDADNGGLSLPAGFCALVVADVTRPRHLAVASNGDVYVSFNGTPTGATPALRGGVVVLRDTNGDGKADSRTYVGPGSGTGVAVGNGYLYFATNTAVLRYRIANGDVVADRADTLVQNLPAAPGEATKSIALGDGGALFVSIGAPSDACQPPTATGSTEAQVAAAPMLKGEDPCAELATRGGVWRFDADRLHQTVQQGERWASGIRNAVALAWNPLDRTLYAGQQGRGTLDRWPGFTMQSNIDLPAEELLRLTRGSTFGWPYCYYDLAQRKLVTAPEYNGDGRESTRCADKTNPILAFPAHWAPDDLLFYTGSQFPASYRGGAFIAFHGRGNPASAETLGYRLVFAPFNGSTPTGRYGNFAQGTMTTATATVARRPLGLAQGPDGSLYLAEDAGGRIWRIMYTGR
jgi:glucose/arabinose dehydrogenase